MTFQSSSYYFPFFFLQGDEAQIISTPLSFFVTCNLFIFLPCPRYKGKIKLHEWESLFFWCISTEYFRKVVSFPFYCSCSLSSYPRLECLLWLFFLLPGMYLKNLKGLFWFCLQSLVHDYHFGACIFILFPCFKL